MDPIFEKVVPPKTGIAVEVEAGQRLRVIDLEGQQVVDMALFNGRTRRKAVDSYSRPATSPARGGYLPRDTLPSRHLCSSAGDDDVTADTPSRGRPRCCQLIATGSLRDATGRSRAAASEYRGRHGALRIGTNSDR